MMCYSLGHVSCLQSQIRGHANRRAAMDISEAGSIGRAGSFSGGRRFALGLARRSRVAATIQKSAATATKSTFQDETGAQWPKTGGLRASDCPVGGWGQLAGKPSKLRCGGAVLLTATPPCFCPAEPLFCDIPPQQRQNFLFSPLSFWFGTHSQVLQTSSIHHIVDTRRFEHALVFISQK
ncbi:hypothetical protein VTK56DRAFT_2835 [Thermocarpiscus australiensis]